MNFAQVKAALLEKGFHGTIDRLERNAITMEAALDELSGIKPPKPANLNSGVVTQADGGIFGMSFEEIKARQQRKPQRVLEIKENVTDDTHLRYSTNQKT